MKIFTKFLTAALALGANANVETKKRMGSQIENIDNALNGFGEVDILPQGENVKERYSFKEAKDELGKKGGDKVSAVRVLRAIPKDDKDYIKASRELSSISEKNRRWFGNVFSRNPATGYKPTEDELIQSCQLFLLSTEVLTKANREIRFFLEKVREYCSNGAKDTSREMIASILNIIIADGAKLIDPIIINEAHYNLGTIYYLNGGLNESIKSFEKVEPLQYRKTGIDIDHEIMHQESQLQINRIKLERFYFEDPNKQEYLKSAYDWVKERRPKNWFYSTENKNYISRIAHFNLENKEGVNPSIRAKIDGSINPFSDNAARYPAKIAYGVNPAFYAIRGIFRFLNGENDSAISDLNREFEALSLFIDNYSALRYGYGYGYGYGSEAVSNNQLFGLRYFAHKELGNDAKAEKCFQLLKKYAAIENDDPRGNRDFSVSPKDNVATPSILDTKAIADIFHKLDMFNGGGLYKHLRSGHEIKPGEYLRRGKSRVDKKDYKGALSDFDLELTLYPKEILCGSYRELLEYRLHAHTELGDKDAAELDKQQIKGIDNDYYINAASIIIALAAKAILWSRRMVVVRELKEKDRELREKDMELKEVDVNLEKIREEIYIAELVIKLQIFSGISELQQNIILPTNYNADEGIEFSEDEIAIISNPESPKYKKCLAKLQNSIKEQFKTTDNQDGIPTLLSLSINPAAKGLILDASSKANTINSSITSATTTPLVNNNNRDNHSIS